MIAVSLPFSSGLKLVNASIGLLYIFITALGFTSLGVAVSLKFSSMEGFQAIVNLLTIPLMFLSGVFYPLTRLPEWTQAVSKLNSLTYSAHGVRCWLAGADVGFDHMNWDIDLLAAGLFEKTTIED